MQEVARDAIVQYVADRGSATCRHRQGQCGGCRPAGTPRSVTDYLSLEDLLEIAEGIVSGAQVRAVGQLASAAARLPMSVFGEDAYPLWSGRQRR